MNTIKLLNFNSYYNRQYKKLPDNWEEECTLAEQANVNFDPNDGVNTTLVLNMPSIIEDNVNYCLVMKDNGDIQSRWFVIDAVRTRLNQYQVSLRRDLLAEYFDEITSAPVFIEKATLSADNPLIFNAEDMSFNQIKTKEYLLKDPTGCPWIIGYFSKDYATEQKVFHSPIETVPSYISYSSLDEVPFIEQIRAGKAGAISSPVDFEMYPYFGVLGNVANYQFKFNTRREIEVKTKALGQGFVSMKASPETATWNAACNYIINAYSANTAWQNALTGSDFLTPEQEQQLLNTYSATAKTIRVGDAASGYQYYSITRGTGRTAVKDFSPEVGTLAYAYFKEAVNNSNYFVVSRDSNENFHHNFTYKVYDLTLTRLPNPASYSIIIPANDQRARLIDAPYDMFAIPYGKLALNDINNHLWVTKKDVALYAAQTIATALGGTTQNLLFDLQLLPYCPITNFIVHEEDGWIDMSALTEGKDYKWIYKNDYVSADTVDSVIFFPQLSDFSFNLSQMWDEENSVPTQIDITEPKVQALCDTYRLVSPNFNGQFEFNAAKNGGIRFFNVDCSYKPYSPYIHVNPDFGALYGKDFNDARGLICGGDFSLPTITDNWIAYQINNKNYLNSFNRQIESMEINNKYGFQADKISAIAGTFQGGISGAGAGMVTGNAFGPYGAAIGAVVGGAAGAISSGIAGAADIRINQALRDEALDYTVDQFGYQLGNIQALPYSLNRVSSFNINNKVFPILEYYTCSDIEKDALRSKVKYNGMTVMTIGSIADYLTTEPSYIKGKLIRLDNLDNHTINEIAKELNKGFYI